MSVLNHATSIFFINDEYVIVLTENNCQSLGIIDIGNVNNDNSLMGSWETSDRRQLIDAIVMIALFIERNDNLTSLYNRLGYKCNEKPSSGDIDILFELAIKRINNCKINIAIFPGSDMLPTVAQQYECINNEKMKKSISISIPADFID